jgi:hypothetical protein
MSNQAARYLKLAEECRERAANARHPTDEQAWLALADEWLKLARKGRDNANGSAAFD